MTAKIIVLCLTAAALLVIAVVAFVASFRGGNGPREPLVRAVEMPDWLREIEAEHLGKVFGSDEERLRFAIRLAEENVRRGTGGPFGAAIFGAEDGRLVAVGVNRVVPANQSWAHAEMTAFARAQNRLKNYSLKDCVLASSCEPCAMCTGATPWSGVRKLIYGAPGDAARATGFDEGDKTPDWRGSLEKRGVRVVGPMLEKDAETPFRLYRETSGTIY
ncbi:MAG: nucleoside deaminase [Candidatus Spyradosoma sp.]